MDFHSSALRTPHFALCISESGYRRGIPTYVYNSVMALNILTLVAGGFARNTMGVCTSTKRDGRWRETSCEEFQEQVEQFAFGLHELGVRPGDRVALHAESCTEWLVADLAILSLGAVDVPIYTTQPPEQIEHILRDSAAKIYIVSTAELFGGVAGAIAGIPGLEATIGIRGAHAAGMRSWSQVLVSGRAKREREPELVASLRAQVQPDDLATLIYTSGTTGTPKGVMLTHANVASNVGSVLERIPWGIEAERGGKILSYLPLSHIFERMLAYLYLHIGYPIFFVEDFEGILEDIQAVKPIHFATVPRLLEKVHAGIHAKAREMTGVKRRTMEWGLGLADRYDVEMDLGLRQNAEYALADALVFKKLRALFGGNLRAITSGGAALRPDVMNFMNAIGIFCGQGYGLTETSPVISVYEKGELRAGSVGKPIRGVDARIAPDGEIRVRGPNVMRGYYGMPEATAEVLDEDGWFSTGDIGRFDADGHLWITDRKKALLKLSTGKYVAPQPIESRLLASRFVEQAVVIGHGEKFSSALLVLDSEAIQRYFAERGEPLAEGVEVADERVVALIQEVVDQANSDLSPWEQVKKFTLLNQPWSVEGGELTPTLKIKRRVVQENHRDEIRAMYG